MQTVRESPRPLRIMLVISNLEFGGAQRQVLHLARSLDPSRFEARICCLSPYMPLLEQAPDPGLRVSVIAKRSKYDLSVVPRLRRLMETTGTDIAHSFLFDAQTATRLAGRWAGAVVVDSERNANYAMPLKRRLVCRMTRGCSDLVIANSHAGADFHRRTHRHPTASYRVVHNGIDVDRFRPLPRSAVRAELGIEQDELVLGMFGSFKPQKNHAMFFRSAAGLVERFPRLRLLVAGDELAGGIGGSVEHKRQTLDLVRDLGIGPRCIFLGNRADPERLYNACDVVVLPSRFEGTPNVVLEALSCGVPVVATDVGDCSRILPDGRIGYIVASDDERALADRLRALLADGGLRERFGAEARRWVTERFSLAQLASRTGDIYESAWRERVTSPERAPSIL